MTQPPGYSLVTSTEDDRDRVLDFLRTFFFRDEPLLEYLQVLEGPDSRCKEMEDYTISSISEGVSLMAVDSSGKLRGVCLNGVLTREHDSLEPPDSQQQFELENYSDLKFRKILKLLKKVYWESNVFKSHPEMNTVMEIRIISVDSSCRGQGIAKALVQRTIDITKEHGMSVVRVDCTSAFSAALMAGLGFHRVFTLPYSEFLDPEGRPFFAPAPPHSSAITYEYSVDSR